MQQRRREWCNSIEATGWRKRPGPLTEDEHPGNGVTQLALPATLCCMAAKIRETAISQLRRGVLEFCVLALLRDGERYSYELVRALGDADGLVTTEGTLYPMLGRLRREGVVDTTWRESPSGPPRRYYHLTPDGQAALDGFAIEWTRFRDSVDTLLGNGALR
jgi:PadR family transcriptional regulator PadR